VRIDLQTLEQQVDARRHQRTAEIPKVDAVIARELDRLHVWARNLALRPLVSDLRRKVEAIRRTELARAQAELQESQRADVDVLERLSRRLLEQVLAIPLATLEAGDVPLDPAQAQYLRRLFALESGATR
jgi:glutamyl-tRNA reductase